MQNEPNRKPRTWTVGILGVLAIFAAGIVFAGAFNWGLDYTNRTEFCTSCHSMQTNLNELKEKLHWKSVSGVHAGCADCHVPKNFKDKMVAKVMAAKDVYHEIMGTIDTPEKYEARRLQMAEAVWAKMKASGSRECKACHSFAHMDFSEQDKFARRKHQNADDRGQSCIDCHKGIGHKLPKDAAEEGEGEDKPADDKAAAEKPAEAAASEQAPAAPPASDAQPAAADAPKEAEKPAGTTEEPKKDDKQG
jgi:cytochrome c-type protein NapC